VVLNLVGLAKIFKSEPLRCCGQLLSKFREGGGIPVPRAVQKDANGLDLSRILSDK
jgi:hypothetical protein